MSLPKVCWLLIVLLGCSHSALAGEWQAAADRVLRHALMQRHPEVGEWRLTALTDSRLEQRLSERVISRVEVAHTGKRSAVRIWCEPAAQRPCATVWFAVSGMHAMLSSQRELAQGYVVAAADFVMAEHDVMNLRCAPLRAPEAVVGLRTTRHLSAGAAVCPQFFEPQPAVSRGESVRVRVAADAIAITARGIAQQDGAVGQTVTIKRPDQSVPIRATVTGVGEVSVGPAHE